MKRQSLKLDEIDWQALIGIARELGCEYRGEPSWRRLIYHLASGKLTVLAKPDKWILNFQETMRAPVQDEWLAKIKARMERDRLRQEQKRRAAGILPRSTPPPMPFTIKEVNSGGLASEETRENS